MASTLLQQLADAVVYVLTYPYDCCEQVASKLLVTLAVSTFADAFEIFAKKNPEVFPGKNNLQKKVKQCVDLLERRRYVTRGFCSSSGV